MILDIKTAVLEREAQKYPFAQRAVEQLRGSCPVTVEPQGQEPVAPLAPRNQPQFQQRPDHEFDLDKKTLRLLSFPGQLFKPCPGTREYLCCGYQILNIGTNCPLDCSYCVLQSYFNQPSLRVFVNVEQQLEAIGETLRNSGGKIFRIGTGEFTDSLALDPIVKWTEVLTSFVAKHENAILEFKTKTVSIEGLLSSTHRDRIVVSWSLNSPSMAASEEHGAPSIQKRLEAARTCQREGYIVGFHFDPLIEHPSWQTEYARTVDLLHRFVDPSKVIWLSLGCLRFMPSLKGVVRRRFPGSHILDGELLPGLDGKMRYIKPLRIEMYGFMKEKLAQWGFRRGLYLCMESRDVWEKALPWAPENSNGLSDYLDRRAREMFGMLLPGAP
jgi:spore photoproduct lyase